MMYFLFRFHHISPSDYRNLKSGEKKIIEVFMKRQLDDMQRETGGG